MSKSHNTLPVQTYVRQRVNTIVTDIGDQSSGSINLDIQAPSDVTVLVVSNSYAGQPELFIAAIGREPSLSDFDVVISPVDQQMVKSQNKVTLHLPDGPTQFQWKSLSTAGTAETFPTACSRLVLAIDQ